MNSDKQSNQHDEQTWIRMALNGDLDAFNQLILKHQDMAYCYAYSLLGDPVLAEDAAQESFIRGFQKLAGFRGGSFRAWILKIVTNAAYDMLRWSKRHPTRPLFPDDENSDENESPFWLADPAGSVEKSVEQTEFSIALYRMLDGLPDVYRSVITLIDLYELEYAEAAQALNVPIGTIKSRLARARLQMKQKLIAVMDYSGNFGSNLTSASTTDAALSKVSTQILENHLNSCVIDAIKGNNPKERERVLKEITEVFDMSKKV